MSVWLVGAGPHAQEYAKVLNSLGVHYDVIGRGPHSAKTFEANIGKKVMTGGLIDALQCHKAPEQAIVAVSFEQLASTAIALIQAGTRRILLEKPGGISIDELEQVSKTAKGRAQVMIGYSRRFYASVTEARKLIEEDGGPVSCNFEFTEWAHTIEPMPLQSEVKNAWVIANSSHVMDLAFHLCGFPKDWKSWHSGRMTWHSASSRFVGAGVTERGVMFSYHADWEAPGRWVVEVLTRKRRFLFKPLEQLQVTLLASTEVSFVVIDDSLDKSFKPGLLKETHAFLSGEDSLFCNIDNQLHNARVYSEMAGYRLGT
jgi:predicted dehydrogenase